VYFATSDRPDDSEFNMSEVEDYLNAKNEFEQCAAQIEAKAQEIAVIAATLRDNPGRMGFSNVGGPGLPTEASMSPDSKNFNADHWPSAASLQGMLADWHQKHGAMMNAWNALPDHMKGNVSPPEQPTQSQQRPGSRRGWTGR